MMLTGLLGLCDPFGPLETEWRTSIMMETFLSKAGEPSAAKGSERSSSLRALQRLSDKPEHDTSATIWGTGKAGRSPDAVALGAPH
jgi:hypothetical protein